MSIRLRPEPNRRRCRGGVRWIILEAGAVDILLNNVWGGYDRMMENGVFTWLKPFREQPLWRWDAMFSAGVIARRRGLIVNISFWPAQKHIGNVPYGVSKAATDKLTLPSTWPRN